MNIIKRIKILIYKTRRYIASKDAREFAKRSEKFDWDKYGRNKP